MDINIAAFGLDLHAVTRVYFTSPVLNPQIEKQAIGRARRLGQTKPITVETLILRDSVEEVILRRRSELPSSEPSKRLSLLDDQPINAWIRNPRILPLPGGADEARGGASPEKMARLATPYSLWGAQLEGQDMVMGVVGQMPKRQMSLTEKDRGLGGSPKKKQKVVRFAGDDGEA